MKILFVCLGNICRSPSAQAVSEHYAKDKGIEGITFDSAGTASWHVGDAPDQRVIDVALSRGYDKCQSYVARHFQESDFSNFDVIIPMDESNLDYIMSNKRNHECVVRLFLDHLPHGNQKSLSLEDPYYYGLNKFHSMFDSIEETVPYIFASYVKKE